MADRSSHESSRGPNHRHRGARLLAALVLSIASGCDSGNDAGSDAAADAAAVAGTDAAADTGTDAVAGADAATAVGTNAGTATGRLTGSDPAFVGSDACAGCHEAQANAWRGSHHDLAMQRAAEDTVLGDFDEATFEHNGIVSRFYRRDGEYLVETDGADGEPAEFRVTHTFGVEPLQQYLVDYERGRLQALSIAWDARPTAAGGQRWFHLYEDEPIPAGDPLHWTGPYQNWNGMCADCHSTAVRKGYDFDSDSFQTRFTEEDVGCEACHGAGAAHVQAPAAVAMRLGGVIRSWVNANDARIATRTGAAPGYDEPDACAACHSRRAQLRDAMPDDDFLDVYRPELLTPGLYHADGQILGEVYVYGSFLQSAMAEAGVVCSDCHEVHSLSLKATGDALCAQCHQPQAFAQVGHHHHESGPAPMCVDCHMRAETYMVVDPRRDHSFRVPRPDVTVALGTPNACNDCHADRTAEWARDRVASWYPDGRSTEPHFGAALAAADTWQSNRSERLRALAMSVDVPGIVRASAVQRIGRQLDAPGVQLLRELARDDDTLVQLAVIEAARGLGPGQQIDVVQRFLSDTDLSLRTAAGETVAPLRDRLSPGRQIDLDEAIEAALSAHTYSSDRPEGLVGRANLAALLGRSIDVERDLTTATERFPWYTPARLNLADHYRATGRETAAYELLSQTADADSGNAAVMLSLGLAQVRRNDYASAVESLRRAVALAPDDPYYAYVLGVALNSVGEGDDAVAVLTDASERFPGYRETWYALATISRDRGELDASAGYARRLLDIAPGDSAALALLEQLGVR